MKRPWFFMQSKIQIRGLGDTGWSTWSDPGTWLTPSWMPFGKHPGGIYEQTPTGPMLDEGDLLAASCHPGSTWDPSTRTCVGVDGSGSTKITCPSGMVYDRGDVSGITGCVPERGEPASSPPQGETDSSTMVAAVVCVAAAAAIAAMALYASSGSSGGTASERAPRGAW